MLGALKAIKGYYDYGIFQAVQVAAIVALRHGEEGRQAQVVEYQHRRDVLIRGLRRLGWTPETPRAGMFVWSPMPEPWRTRVPSIDFAMKLLEEANVVVSPGRGFGETGEGCLPPGPRGKRRIASGKPCDRSDAACGLTLLVNDGFKPREAVRCWVRGFRGATASLRCWTSCRRSPARSCRRSFSPRSSARRW